MWYVNGKLHRSDGPAVIDHEYQKWFTDEKLHRVDGPAVIDNHGRKEWYMNGQCN
jgi:hypothetical protein